MLLFSINTYVLRSAFSSSFQGSQNQHVFSFFTTEYVCMHLFCCISAMCNDDSNPRVRQLDKDTHASTTHGWQYLKHHVVPTPATAHFMRTETLGNNQHTYSPDTSSFGRTTSSPAHSQQYPLVHQLHRSHGTIPAEQPLRTTFSTCFGMDYSSCRWAVRLYSHRGRGRGYEVHHGSRRGRLFFLFH